MLKSLISHHIALIDRFSSDEFEEFSIIFLKLDNIKDLEIKKMIQVIFRDSDLIFEYESNYIILLPKTGWNGALKLLQELQEFLNQNLKDTIVTYPDDGNNAHELLIKLSKLIKNNYNLNINFI
jgi:hypothetical protein